MKKLLRISPLTALLAAVLMAGIALAATPAWRVNGLLFGSNDRSLYASAFGVKGDGTTDDTTALQAWLTAAQAGSTLVLPAMTYKITSRLTLSANNVTVIAYGAKLVQSGTLQGGILVTGTDAKILGLWLYNSRGGLDWNNGAPTAAIGVEFSGSSNSLIRDCKIENWGGIGIKYLTSPYLKIVQNRIIGIGAAGGLIANSNNNLGTAGYGSGTSSNGVKIQGNDFSDLAQGAFQGNDWSDTNVEGNFFTNIIGQNGVYFDNVFGGSFVGNTIDTTGQVGIYLQVASNATQDGGSIVIADNTIMNTTQDGIAIVAGQGGLTFYHKGVSVHGNTIRSSSQNGIQIDQLDDYEVSDNVIDTAANFGIFANSNSRNGSIKNNRIRATGFAGIYVVPQSSAYQVLIDNNVLRGCNTATSGTTYYNSQMYLSTGILTVRNNIVQSPGAGAVWNVYTDATATYTLKSNTWASTLSSTFTGGSTLALDKRIVLAWSTSLTPDISLGSEFYTSISNATAATLNNPINPTSENRITIRVNNGFGTPGTVSLGTKYKLRDGATSFPMPANGYQTAIDFQYDGTNWLEIGRNGLTPVETMANLSTTQTAALTLQNNTAAAAGAQQNSPCIHLGGQGWQTNTSASQAADSWLCAVPAQGAANPSVSLVLYTQINGGTITSQATINSAGDISATGGNARFLGGSLQRISSGTLSVCTDANCTGLTMGKQGQAYTNDGILQVGIPAKANNTIASATTIAPTAFITHITGTTTLQTLTAPTDFAQTNGGGCLVLVFDGIAPWNAVGNIFVAGTPTTAGTSVMFCYDNATAKWYPTRIASLLLRRPANDQQRYARQLDQAA